MMGPNMNHEPVPRPAHLARRLEVETPEQVTIGFEIAGIGSRALAAIYDLLLLALLLLLMAIGGTFLSLLSGWSAAVFTIAGFAAAWGYFALFEGLWGGRTPGKRSTGIRVILDTGHPITLQAALVRNLVRIVDFQPGLSGLVGLLFVALHPKGKRLGDIVAGTIVIRDEASALSSIGVAAGAASTEPMAATAVAPEARLQDEEYRLLDQFLRRAPQLPTDVRRRFQGDLASRFADRYAEWPADHPRYLSEVYAAERTARQAPGAGRRDAAGRRRLRVADRFVALRQAAWEAFRVRAIELERVGVAHLAGEEVLAFAGEYRAMAADLARATTYGVDQRTVAHLERIVTAGHNALYGMRRVRRLPAQRLLLGILPAAAFRCRREVITAALLFVIPAAIGFGLLRERPAVALEVLPETMLARAAAGPARQAEGVGYAETPSPYLPLVASSVITNNVQVAFGAFAFGITAGIGTVLLLVFNGLFFGAVLGHFANVGLAGWLLTFVAGHGVLELTAIFIAGGAGLLVARALIAPGDLARGDALVIAGREAMRLVGAATCLLLLAGTIEGLLSASDAPAAIKLAVSAATAVLLVLYFAAGRRFTESSEGAVRAAPRRLSER
jgi:uncharacterized membrane protein SpoIIM required for sporulation/uncharacterized RDD family membrane protein YckC